MAHLVFDQRFALPDITVNSLDDIANAFSPQMESGYKYFFECVSRGINTLPDGKSYSYVLRCRAIPMTGGPIAEFDIAYSNEPIPVDN